MLLCFAKIIFDVILRNNHSFLLVPDASEKKKQYLEGMLCFTSKSCMFLFFFLSAGLLSHHHALFPRYLYHVLKNSVAPSPIMQARHLDRMAPSTRSQWIKEWRSLRGGGHVRHSDLSPPPSPTLETPVDFYLQSPISISDDVALNVISENCLRPQQS